MFFLTISGSVTLTFHLFAAKQLKSILISAMGQNAQTGCYVYFDEAYKPLYVGKSKDLATRLTHHATNKGIETHIDWSFLGVIFTNDAHLTEQTLIHQLQPPYNKLGKNDRNKNQFKQKED